MLADRWVPVQPSLLFHRSVANLSCRRRPPVLVLDPDQDALHDRVADYVARLRAAGKAVELVVFRGQGHAFFVREPCGEASDELIRVIRRFVHGG